MADRNRAKQILREIIRLSGGVVQGKTCLFKTFYFAHLYYAKRAADYLSDWPIVRMPNGPGIDDADSLISELVKEGVVEEHRTSVGPYDRIEYHSIREEIPGSLSDEAIIAIREAVEFTKGRPAAELSDLTHEHSRSWKSAKNGDELNIYIDLLTDQEYQEGKQRVEQIASTLQDVWD